MGRTSVSHKRQCRKYKCPLGDVSTANWRLGKTAGGWKDSTDACQSRSSNSYDQATLHIRHAYNSPKPPWLSPLMLKISGRTHGGAGNMRCEMEQIDIEWDGDLRMPPCKRQNECPYRSATCHGRCKGYKEFRAAKDAEAEKQRIERSGMYASHDRVVVNRRLRKQAKTGGVKSV